MTLSLAERDVLKSAVKAYPFDVDAKDAEYAERASKATKDEPFARPAKADIQKQWESRPVEIVVIGDPTPVLDLYDARGQNLHVYLLGYRDKRAAKAYQISADQRAKGSLTVFSKTDPVKAAETYVAHVRPGHGEIDGLVLGAHVDQLFELTMCPIPTLLDAWFPKLGIGAQLVVGGMNLKAVQTAVQTYIDDGRLVEVSTAGNCWTGRKVSEEPAEAEETKDADEKGSPSPAVPKNPLMRIFGR